jgi:hypothetical protein
VSDPAFNLSYKERSISHAVFIIFCTSASFSATAAAWASAGSFLIADIFGYPPLILSLKAVVVSFLVLSTTTFVKEPPFNLEANDLSIGSG